MLVHSRQMGLGLKTLLYIRGTADCGGSMNIINGS